MKSFLFNFQIDVWTEMAKEMKSNFGPARSKPAGKAGSVIGKICIFQDSDLKNHQKWQKFGK